MDSSRILVTVTRLLRVNLFSMIAALRVIIVVYFAKQVNVIRTDYWSSFRKITDQIHKQTTGKMKIIFPENSPSYR